MPAGPFAKCRKIGTAQRSQKILNELHLLPGQHKLTTVGRLIEAVEGRAAGGALLLDVGLLALGKGAADHIGAGRHQRLMHGDVDIIAAAGGLATQQRHQHAREAMQAAYQISDRNAGDRRPSVVAQGQAQHAGHGFERQVVRHPAGIGAGLAERADRAIDDARVLGAHRVVADAEARRDTGPERLHDHVSLAGETKQVGAAGFALEVEHDALLAAPHVAEKHRGALVLRQNVAAGIALSRRLDLDHLRAVVGQRGGEIGTRQEPGEVDDLDAFELHGRYFSLSAPSGEQAA